MKLQDKLIEYVACQPAIEWVGDKTLAEALATCKRGL